MTTIKMKMMKKKRYGANNNLKMLTTIKSKMATTMLFYLIFLKLKQRKEITSENNLQNRVKTIISKMEIDITQSDENKSNVIATKLFDSDTETDEIKKRNHRSFVLCPLVYSSIFSLSSSLTDKILIAFKNSSS